MTQEFRSCVRSGLSPKEDIYGTKQYLLSETLAEHYLTTTSKLSAKWQDSHQERKPTLSSSTDLKVQGKRPDLRYDERLYFRAKVSDLTRRSLNGNCRAHCRFSDEHFRCSDMNETCFGCLAIAKEAMEIYNQERTLPAELFRLKIPVCTCNLMKRNILTPMKETRVGEGIRLKLFKLAMNNNNNNYSKSGK